MDFSKINRLWVNDLAGRENIHSVAIFRRSFVLDSPLQNGVLYIAADSNHIKLTVKDNGKSDFSAENASERLREGFGLKKLRSYADKCGGTAVFSNENGFKSAITLPFEGGQNG